MSAFDIFPPDVFERTLQSAFLFAGVGAVSGIALSALKHNANKKRLGKCQDNNNGEEENQRRTDEKKNDLFYQKIMSTDYDLSHLVKRPDLDIIYQSMYDKSKRNKEVSPLVKLLGGNLNTISYLLQQNATLKLTQSKNVNRLQVTKFNDYIQRTVKKISTLIKLILEKSKRKGSSMRLQFIRDMEDLTCDLWTIISNEQKNIRRDIDMRMDKYID